MLVSTAVGALVVVAKRAVLSILPSISVIFCYNLFFLTSSLVSGIFLSASSIFFSISYLSVRYCVFETNILVSIALTFMTNLSHTVFLITSTKLLDFFKSAGTFCNLSTSVLSTSAFNLDKSDFVAKFDVSTLIGSFKSVFVA